MGRRFSRIKHAIKELGLPETSEVVIKFRNYRAGLTPYTGEKVKRGASVPTSFLTFSHPTTAPRFVTKISGRANTNLSKTGLTADNLNLKIGASQITEGTRIKGFQPAKVIAFVPAAEQGGTGSNPTSKITGLKYDKRLGDSFTFPFGREAGGAVRQTQSDMQAYLVGKAGPGVTVTFKPEIP